MKTKKRNRLGAVVFLALLLLALVVSLQELTGGADHFSIVTKLESVSGAEKKIQSFAEEHGLEPDAWPEPLITLLQTNPEAEDFVLNYPLLKDEVPRIDLTGYESAEEVPLLLQWDTRWGYAQYGDTVMGLSGCGPTCLSMVCLYLMKDSRYDPLYVARFSEENGYCVPGSGSAWTLISEGGGMLGLDVVEIPLDRERIFRNLEVGNPIICVMGPGDFTTSGHFIVMTGCEDGMIRINDPNSPSRSERLWDYEQIKDQIQNLWVCRLPT